MGNKILYAFTTNDAEEQLGRPLRDGEEERLAKAIEYSTIGDTLDAVLDQFRDPADGPDASQLGPCEECGAPAGRACEIWCIADQAE